MRVDEKIESSVDRVKNLCYYSKRNKQTLTISYRDRCPQGLNREVRCNAGAVPPLYRSRWQRYPRVRQAGMDRPEIRDGTARACGPRPHRCGSISFRGNGRRRSAPRKSYGWYRTSAVDFPRSSDLSGPPPASSQNPPQTKPGLLSKSENCARLCHGRGFCQR